MSMQEIDIYEHQAGWGFIGITAGIITGPLSILALNLAQDPAQFLDWPAVLRTVGIELVVATVAGWLLGVMTAFGFYQNTTNRTASTYFAAAGVIFRTAFMQIFVIASIYYWFTSRGQTNALPYIFWATGGVGWLVSKKVGEALAASLLN